MRVIQSCVHAQMHRPPERNAQLDENKVPQPTKLESEWLTWKICDRPAFGDASCSSTCSPDWSFIMALEWLSYNFTCTDNPHTFTLKYIRTSHTPLPIMGDYACNSMSIVQHPLSLSMAEGLALPAVDSDHNSSPV